MLKFKCYTHLLKRSLSTSPHNVLEHLPNKTLIRVSGPEVANYLQGLITNDVEHLSAGPGSMYTVFLNHAGRVLYDTIIYKNLEANTYLIECDKQVSEALQKHLKLYRVRRKIDITSLADELKVYVLFDYNKTCFDSNKLKISDDTVVPYEKLSESQPPTLFKTHQDILIYRDARIIKLGYRIIAKNGTDVTTQLGDFVSIKENTSDQNYRRLRYSLGVGEGIEDLPPGDCFPLECNCDYLHGVSFHKGCYIGQELTARVHHTGAVRKRLMPIHFTKIPSKLPDTKIVQENVNLGKLRGIEKDVGLGLLRITKTLAFKEIKLGDGIGVVSKPSWWPTELPKEKANIPKLQ